MVFTLGKLVGAGRTDYSENNYVLVLFALGEPLITHLPSRAPLALRDCYHPGANVSVVLDSVDI